MSVPKHDNILSKSEFVSILDKVVASHDVAQGIRQTIKDSAKETDGDMIVDFFDPFVLYSGQLSGLVKTLEVMFCDTESEWISWWLFDCDYGHDEQLLASATDADGKAIPLSTLGDLYDCLIRNLDEARS